MPNYIVKGEYVNMPKANFLVVIVLLLQAFMASSQSSVCYMQQAAYSSNSRVMYRQGSQAYYSTYGCGLWNWKRCRRTHYRAIRESFRDYYLVTTYSAVSQCCSGHSGTPPNCQVQCTGGCQNGGTCTLPDICTCAPGWTGTNCERDIKECPIGAHNCSDLCVELDGGYECDCSDGYELEDDRVSCEDVDECQITNGGCNQTCINTVGSYQCSCWDGYELDVDNHTCIDIKECLIGAHNCTDLCVELDGGYECDCSDGYELEDDKVSCEDIDECAKSNGRCRHVCENHAGGYRCSCQSGYLLGTDKYTCEDINECSNSNGGCQHNCTNTIGSYYCSCAAGYSLDINNHNCSFNTAEQSTKRDNPSNTVGPIAGTSVVIFIIVIVLVVVAVCVFMRYRKKHNSSSRSPAVGVPNDLVNTAVNKGKEQSGDAINNPTYNHKASKGNDYDALSENQYIVPAVSKDYKVPHDCQASLDYQVPHDYQAPYDQDSHDYQALYDYQAPHDQAHHDYQAPHDDASYANV